MSEKEITHDGAVYILKENVETIISSRLSTYASKLNERDTTIAAQQTTIDEQTAKLTTSDTLQSEITRLNTELNSSNTRYDRHSVLSGIGINDTSVRATFEHLYSNLTGEKPPFNDWISEMKNAPENAPLIVRSFLAEQAQPDQPAQPNQPAQTAQSVQPNPPARPAANSGVIPVGLDKMSNDDVINRASRDPQFYKEHREVIQQIYRTGNRGNNAPR